MVDSSRESPFYVREVYNGEDALEQFECALNQALDDKHEIIVIEPAQLGKATENWIAFGNCLQNAAILSGFGSVMSGMLMPDRSCFYVSLGTISVLVSALYGAAWLKDPCSAYQVEKNFGRASGDSKYLFSGKNGQNSSTAVVLIRRRRTVACFLHASFSICAVCVCAWNLFRTRKSS